MYPDGSFIVLVRDKLLDNVTRINQYGRDNHRLKILHLQVRIRVDSVRPLGFKRSEIVTDLKAARPQTASFMDRGVRTDVFTHYKVEGDLYDRLAISQSYFVAVVDGEVVNLTQTVEPEDKK